MTSVKLRKPQKFNFPAASTSNKISKIENIEDLGQFYLDKVVIVLDVFWRDEDIVGSKSKPFDVTSEKNGKKIKKGVIIYCHHEGHAFQIYRGRGQVRNLQFNPRHFSSLQDFVSFARLIIDRRKYHISQVHFAWFLYKSVLSVIFLYWSIFFKGLRLSGKHEYKIDQLKTLQKGSIQGFSYGKGDHRGKAYDTDEYNTKFKRKEDHKVHGCINFEIGLGGDRLRGFGITNLSDLIGLTDFGFVLERVKFCKPQKGIFKVKKYKHLLEVWEREGATEMCRLLYEKSQAKDYNVLDDYLTPLRIKNMSFKKALLQLAASDYEKFKKGISQDHRKTMRNAHIDMEPIFRFT